MYHGAALGKTNQTTKQANIYLQGNHQTKVGSAG